MRFLLAPLFLFAATSDVQAVAQQFKAPKPRAAVVKGSEGKELHELMQRCEAFGFTGSVYVSKKGKPILLQGYGLADLLTGAPCTPETLFDIASAAKQVTAAAILNLEADGKLNRDDSITEHLPGDLELKYDITIDQLLTHTSGYPRNAVGGRGPDLEVAAAAYLSANPTRRPGEGFEYWNGGYALLAGIVEQASGLPFEDYVQEELFEPAKLLHTDFIQTERVDASRLSRANEHATTLTTQYIKGWGYQGMGGVLTSAADLGIWVDQVCFGKKVLKKKVRALLFRPELQGYARGWRVGNSRTGKSVIEHGGDRPGFHTVMRRYTNEEYTVLVLTNVDGVSHAVAGAIEAALFAPGALLTPPEVEEWEQGEAENLSGIWQADGLGEIRIEQTNNSLIVRAASNEGRETLMGASTPTSLTWEETTAVEVVRSLIDGDTKLLTEHMQESIPPNWPDRIIEGVLPELIEERGKVVDVRLLGSFVTQRSQTRTVLVEVEHANGMWPVEVAFANQKIGRLAWDTDLRPKAIHFGHTGDGEFVYFNFSRESDRPKLIMSGDAEIELQAMGKQWRLAKVPGAR